jgi:predicted naringenin-chalcone synthase
MGLAILGLGTALPDTALSQEQSVALTCRLSGLDGDAATLVSQIFQHTTIRQRHTVLGRQVVDDLLQGTTSSRSPFLLSATNTAHGPTTDQRMKEYVRLLPDIAVTAARRALAQAALAPAAITHLVTVSCTGFSAPGWDIALLRRLGLAPSTQRTHIGFMGCHGALNGLRVAKAYAEADASACVLLCAAEACTLHCQYEGSPKQLIANALFSDGAAALVGRCLPGTAWNVLASGSCLLPDCAQAMTWEIGDHGFTMTLSAKVPELIQQHLRPYLEPWLATYDLSIPAIGSWAIHPGGPRILDAVEYALGLPTAATATSRAVLAECGNMSSPTVLFLLERLRREEAALPCVALGFGPGLTVEAALLV